MRTSIRIGAGQGFYGDTLRPAIDIARSGEVDYICFDALAELTLAILQKDRQRKPELGYAQDVGAMATALLPEVNKRGLKLITNAGGMNPYGAARKVQEAAQALDMAHLKIAVVSGDDIAPHIGPWEALGIDFANMESGDGIRERLAGAGGVRPCLAKRHAQGAKSGGHCAGSIRCSWLAV